MHQLLLNVLHFESHILCNAYLQCISKCLEHDGQVYDGI